MRKYRITNENFLENKVLFIKTIRTAFKGIDLREAKSIADVLYDKSNEPRYKQFEIMYGVSDAISYNKITHRNGFNYRNDLLSIVKVAIERDDTVEAEKILHFVNTEF